MYGFTNAAGSSLWRGGRFAMAGAEFRWQAKVYDDESSFGVDNGRVSKLWVARLQELPDNGRYWQEVAYYDRGWCTLPSTQEAKAAVAHILKMFK